MEKLERAAKSKTIGRLIRSIRKKAEFIAEFDETLWVSTVDSVTVIKEGKMVFHFKNSSSIGIINH